MKITTNIEMLEVNSMGNKVNIPLAWDKNNLVLMDTGFPGQTEAIVQAITNTGHSAENITHIILTHQDFDHIGCVRDLLKLCPKAQVMAHSEEAPYISGKKAYYKVMVALGQYESLTEEKKVWCGERLQSYPSLTIPVTHKLKEGDVLPICGGIEVIHTPGHTSGHICLFFKESRILVSGDALSFKDGQIAGPSPQNTADVELSLRSLEKIKKIPFNTILSFHGGYLKVA